MPSPARQLPPPTTTSDDEEEAAEEGNRRRRAWSGTGVLPSMPAPFVRLTRLADIPPALPTPTPAPRSAGFCHSCNRQVQINLETFTCSACSGGFVEFSSEPATTTTAAAARPEQYRGPRDLLSSLFATDDLSWLPDLGSSSSSGGAPSLFSPPPAAETRRPVCRHHHQHRHHHHFLGSFSTPFDAGASSSSSSSAAARRDVGGEEPPAEAILINIPRILRPVPFADLALLGESPPSAATAAAASPDGGAETAPSASNRPISMGDASAAVSTGIFAADLASSDAARAAHARYTARRTIAPDRYSLRSHAAPAGAGVRTRSTHYVPRRAVYEPQSPERPPTDRDPPPHIRRRHRTFRSFSHRMRDEVPMDLDSSNDESERRSSSRPAGSGADPASSAADPTSRRSRSPPFFRFAGSRGGGAGFHVNFLDDDEDDDGFLQEHGAIIITTLLNQLRNNHRGPAPASDTQLEALPLVDIDQSTFDKNIQCAVCMDDFKLNEKAKQMPCKHLFHEPCIVPWLKLHATCPVCRKNIGGDSPTANDQQQPTSHRYEIFRPAYNFMTRRQTSSTSSTSTASTSSTAATLGSTTSASSASSSWSSTAAGSGSSSSASSSSTLRPSWFARHSSSLRGDPLSAGQEAGPPGSQASSSLFSPRDERTATTGSFSSLFAADRPSLILDPPAGAPRFSLNPRMFRIHFNEAPPSSMRLMPMSSTQPPSGAFGSSSSGGASSSSTDGGFQRDRFLVRLNLSGGGESSSSAAPRSVSMAAGGQDPFIFGTSSSRSSSSSSSRNSGEPSQFSFLSGLARLSSDLSTAGPRSNNSSSAAPAPAYNTRGAASSSSARLSPASTAGPSRFVSLRGCRVNPYGPELRDRLRSLTTRHQTEMRRRAQASFRGPGSSSSSTTHQQQQQSGEESSSNNLRARMFQSLGPVISSISLRIGVRPTPAAAASSLVTTPPPPPPATVTAPATRRPSTTRNDESFSSNTSASSSASSQSTVTPKQTSSRRHQSDSDSVIELDSDEVSASASASSSSRSSMTLRSHVNGSTQQNASSSSLSSSLVITIDDDDDEDDHQRSAAEPEVQPSSSSSKQTTTGRTSKWSRGSAAAEVSPSTSTSAVTSKRKPSARWSNNKSSAAAEVATASRTRSALRTAVKKEPAVAASTSPAAAVASRNLAPSPSDSSSISSSAVIYEEDILISDSDLASHAGAVDDDLLADLIHLDDDDDDDDHDSTSASGSSHGDEEDETDSDSFELADDQVSAIELDDILDDLDAELTSYAASSAGTTTTSRSTATSTSNRRSLMAAAAEPARKRQRIQTQRSTDTL